MPLVLHYFTPKTKKLRILRTAFTGIAAINVVGVTHLSFFNPPIRPLLPGRDEIKYLSKPHQKRKVTEDIDAIVIEEVYLRRVEIFQAIPFRLQNNGVNTSIIQPCL